MRLLAVAVTLVGLCCLAACGGGGSDSPLPTPAPLPAGSPSTAPTAAPSTPPTVSPTVKPTVAPTAPPTVPPTVAPTVPPVVNATSPPITLTDNPAVVYGNVSTFNALGAIGFAPIDNIACTKALPALAQHFHDHLTLYMNGQQFAIPAAIGIYHPILLFGPASAGWYNYNPADAAACHYDIHVHAGDGVIHIETANATDTFNLKQFLDIWGVTMSSTGFLNFSGPTRWFETDELGGGSGTHKVTEITGVDPATIKLTPHIEFTVEVGTPLVNIPNYIFIDKNDL